MTPPSDGQACLWEGCAEVAADAELLYIHLCNEHIGRKSTNNLCLTCKWKDCGTTCAKRDHITSHLRGVPPLCLSTLTRWHPLTKIRYSAHAPQASRLRNMQQDLQTSAGLEETRKDPYSGTSRPAQAFQGNHSHGPCLFPACSKLQRPTRSSTLYLSCHTQGRLSTGQH